MRVTVELGHLAPKVRLFHSRHRFLTHCERKIGLVEEEPVGAMTAYSEGRAAVLFPRGMHRDLAFDSSVLAHEACHVAMEHMRWLGDETWGDEALAYLVQAVTHGLVEAHVDWMARGSV